MTKEEYIAKNEESNILFEQYEQYSEPKFDCPVCKTGGMCKDNTIILPSFPPKYQYICNSCRHVEYLTF